MQILETFKNSEWFMDTFYSLHSSENGKFFWKIRVFSVKSCLLHTSHLMEREKKGKKNMDVLNKVIFP